mgnify:FL=1
MAKYILLNTVYVNTPSAGLVKFNAGRVIDEDNTDISLDTFKAAGASLIDQDDPNVAARASILRRYNDRGWDSNTDPNAPVWILPPGVVADAAELADRAGSSTGDRTFVLTFQAYFQYNPVSALTADGVTVIVAPNGGRWLRVEEPQPVWLAQATWYIDAVAGDDENDGLTSVTALKTHAELSRRWGDGALNQNTTVFLLTDIPQTDALNINVSLAFETVLTYQGTAVTSRSGTFSAVTARDRATNQPWVVTDAGASWTAENHKRLRVTSRAGIGGMAWANKDRGSHQARTTEGVIVDTEFFSVANATPSPGDTYVVETLSKVFLGEVNVRGDLNLGAGVPAYIRFMDLNFAQLSGGFGYVFPFAGAVTVALYNCLFEALLLTVNYNNIFVHNCDLKLGVFVAQGLSYFQAGHAGGAYGMLINPGSNVEIDRDMLLTGKGCVVEGGARVVLGTVGAFDCTVQSLNEHGSGFVVRPSGAIEQRVTSTGVGASALWGSGNAGYGVGVMCGGTHGYNSGTTRTVTGALGDLNLGEQTSAPPQDALTGAYSAALALTWVNVAGGFSGNAQNPVNGAKVAKLF